MQAVLVPLACLVASAELFHVAPPFLPYHSKPDHVCATFPFCYQEIGTGAWKSMPETPLINTTGASALPRDVPVDSSECWLDGYYCRSDASNLITRIQMDSAEDCQKSCVEEDSCLVWSLHDTRGQGYCSLLRECVVNRKCADSENCSTGGKTCKCQKLDYFPGNKDSEGYARWTCPDVNPYEEEMSVGTVCTASCPAWKESTLQSTCLRNGKWSATSPAARRSLGYAASYPTPDQPDMECGCQEVGTYNYDPNTETGARWICDGRDANEYKKAGGWTIRNTDRCELFCSEAPEPVVSVYCDGATWTGKPELGFWCYDKPENSGPQEQPPAATKGDPQCSRPYKTLSDKWRMVEYGVPHTTYHCDRTGSGTDWTNLEAGWHTFRFDRRYATLPSSPPAEENRNMKTCGTYRPSWSPSALPTIGQTPQDIDIHFAYESYEIMPDFSVTGKVVACPGEDGQNMFLYYLPEVYSCYAAYCAV